MKAEELRIGNYVNDNDNNIVEIESIWGKLMVSFNTLSDKTLITRFPTKHLKTIQLTEEWLIKFGFTKKKHKWKDNSISENLFFIKNYFIEFTNDGILFCELHYSGQSWFICHIDYVHQLQNLYFALTGCGLQYVA